MLAAVASYFSSPTSAGASAVNTSPQRLQRNFSSSHTVASMGRLPLDSHQHTGFAQRIHFATLTIWTPVARAQRRMLNLNPLSSLISARAVASMAWRFCLRSALANRLMLFLADFQSCLFQYLFRFLCARLTQQAAQICQRGFAILQ